MENKEENDLPLKGFEIKRCAVAALAPATGSADFDIFSSARASPSGYLVSKAPDASARSSRFLEIANCINRARIGAKIRNTNPRSFDINLF